MLDIIIIERKHGLNHYIMAGFCLDLKFKPHCLRPHLGGVSGMKWKGMKRIILEYSSLSLFGSFNGVNRKSILLFESLSGRE